MSSDGYDAQQSTISIDLGQYLLLAWHWLWLILIFWFIPSSLVNGFA